MKKRVMRLPELTTKAKIVAGLIVGFVIAVIATFVVTTTIISRLSGSDETSQENFASKDTATRQKDARTSVAEAIESGDDKKAATISENAINAEKDPTRKVELAIDQSKLLSLGGKSDQAIDVAKKAESYSDDKYLISDWLGRLYATGKRYDEAAKYYAQAGSLADSPTNKGGYTKQYYDDKVAAMKKLAEEK